MCITCRQTLWVVLIFHGAIFIWRFLMDGPNNFPYECAYLLSTLLSARLQVEIAFHYTHLLPLWFFYCLPPPLSLILTHFHSDKQDQQNSVNLKVDTDFFCEHFSSHWECCMPFVFKEVVTSYSFVSTQNQNRMAKPGSDFCDILVNLFCARWKKERNMNDSLQ